MSSEVVPAGSDASAAQPAETSAPKVASKPGPSLGARPSKPNILAKFAYQACPSKYIPHPPWTRCRPAERASDMQATVQKFGLAGQKSLGDARETWCCVEKDSRYDTNVEQKKHFKKHNRSTIFDVKYNIWKARTDFKVLPEVHDEKRHHFIGIRTDEDHLPIYHIAPRE